MAADDRKPAFAAKSGVDECRAASQLDVAANRVATIERVHRRLHYLDGVKTVEFKQYLEDLCRDFSTMLNSEDRQSRPSSSRRLKSNCSPPRHSARLHHQRTDHERSEIRQRPDHGQVGANPVKATPCRSPMMARFCRRI